MPPSRLLIAADVRSDIERLAAASWPHEMVGVLGGGPGLVLRFAALPNDAAAADRFVVDPLAWWRTVGEFERDGLGFAGFVHSHPNGDAAPSPTDRAALWHGCAHLIAATASGRTLDLRAFYFDDPGDHELEIAEFVARRRMADA